VDKSLPIQLEKNAQAGEEDLKDISTKIQSEQVIYNIQLNFF